MLENSAMLIDLTINMWTGRKMDKQISAEIDIAKNTKTQAGNYHKKLLAGTKSLDNLASMANAIRQWHYKNTLPWSDSGSRLLPMANFFDYKQQLSQLEQDFNNEVDNFLTAYPTLVQAAAFQLGNLFNNDEYPDVDKLRNRFRFSYAFMPLPSAGDFRVDMEEQYRRELQEQYEKFYQTRINDAMRDAWDRLHECLERISMRLDGEEKQVFRDTLVTNAVEMCDMLTKLNITNDPKLEQARKKLESALIGVTADDLRKDKSLRKDTKARVDEILAMF